MSLCLTIARPLNGSIIDLTTGSGSSGFINDGLFVFANEGGGSGVIDPFVRIQRDNTEQGYNTSNSVLPFDEVAGSFTHDLRLNEIPIIEVGGIMYFEFILEINEDNGDDDDLIGGGNGGGQFLSLDDIQIYTSITGSQNTTVLADLGTLRYHLDAGVDSHILLDDSLNSSGVTDMTAFIPISLFDGANPNEFVVFYSLFGLQGSIVNDGGDSEDYGSSDGFEQWAVQFNENSVFIPSPGAAALGLLSFLIGGRRRRRNI